MPARRKKTRLSDAKMEILADPAFIARVDEAAARVGLTRSAYVRLAVSERMDRDGQAREGKRKE
jgi:hypothetical protein